ncbi:MAG: sulfite reductase, dissimilatory-type subunit alpha [Candidatus Lambdaproteobacteria bacterium RIFOXYD2_FULL_50_16]|uniref:Sulfite reductase, dissimilatory-type subunit alpha n=1 Tax=Candidatus Lambdaproteobacteria bacterium RIFOXYD2_FULL_50_16 TaxID=1817772 RepID=A0A1F6G7K0_9PROT|nr:MAG: sulfite reductase, dissimilatory-type subunit alpha [Candidatus Lambdaproteobacteria bacterium RIFOXYD2_FULL_50_16]
MSNPSSETPLLDELLKGRWPSFVKEMKEMADTKPMVRDVLRQLEKSYVDKKTHWKHGGIVGVKGYGGGIIGRYSDSPEEFPGAAHFHTVRVNQPAGWFYNTQALRDLCEIFDKYGSGLTNMHGSTGDIILLGTTTDELEPIFSALTEKGWDLGGSGSALRTPSCCVGPARCEWAMFDCLDICHDITHHYQDEIHRPAFPYKFKIKVSGCPNDCVSSIARADFSIIGTWRDHIRVNDEEMTRYVANGRNPINDAVLLCPTRAIEWDGKKIKIDNENCVRCMQCINAYPRAIKPGLDRGATILIGAKAPIVQGALFSSVLVPFMKIEEPYDEVKELLESIWDVWDDHGENKERIGELVERMGKGEFLEKIGIAPDVQMVIHPRENPYIFYDEFYEEEDDATANK